MIDRPFRESGRSGQIFGSDKVKSEDCGSSLHSIPLGTTIVPIFLAMRYE